MEIGDANIWKEPYPLAQSGTKNVTLSYNSEYEWILLLKILKLRVN